MPFDEISHPNMKQFQADVWRLARQIPAGKVFTYGQIGELIPGPAEISPEDYKAYRARWVGSAMARCPQDVPWQRVINSQGKISFKPGPQYDRQRRLLEDEGIQFDARARIDLKRFGWDGPARQWILDNHFAPLQDDIEA